MRILILTTASLLVDLGWGRIARASEASPWSDSPHPVTCGTMQGFQLAPVKKATRFTLNADREAWIAVRETGQQIKVDAAQGTEVLSIPIPLRLGRYWIHAAPKTPLNILRFQQNAAPGYIKVEVFCGDTAPKASPLEWYRRASVLAASLQTPVEKDDLPALLSSLERLRESALDPDTAALAQHMSAQALLVNDSNRDAAAAFAAAEGLWTNAYDFERALAARVARTEDERRVGNYDQAIELTLRVPQTWPLSGYYPTRLQNSRCLSLSYLGSFADANSCYSQTLRELDNLGEAGELVDTLYDYSLTLAKHGDEEGALAIAKRALNAATDIDVPYIQGHVRYLLEWLMYRRGEIAQSLTLSDDALAYFTLAHMPRWEANVLFDVSTLYLEMGASDESLAALSQAVARLSYRDAPTRMATAMVTLARIERQAGQFESALLWSRTARASFEQMKMPVESESAELLEAQVLTDLGDGRKIDGTLAEHLRRPGLRANEWQLLALRRAIENRDTSAANRALLALRSAKLSLPDAIELALRDSQWTEGNGDFESAHRTLSNGLDTLFAIAWQSQAPTVHYLLMREALPLRRAGIDLALTMHDTAPAPLAIDSFWQWLASPSPEARRNSPVSDQRDVFDRAVAGELLGTTTGASVNAEAQRALLRMLAGPAQEGGAQARDSLSPGQLQKKLAPDEAFVAYLGGESRSAMLWLWRDRAELVNVGEPAELRGEVLALRELVRSPSTSMMNIDDTAVRLSDHLLASTHTGAPPRRLHVLEDPTLAGIPWGVLHWPGREDLLLDTTTLDVVQLRNETTAEVDKKAGQVRVLVLTAAAGGKGLPELVGASGEAADIRSALSSSQSEIEEIDKATRNDVLKALRDEDAWVHIAAHGSAIPSRIGYSGLWLAPEQAGEGPAFLSWINVLDTGVRADMVILDACQLGDSGIAVNGNLSFAEAVARAGARHVIAAMWPVSDSAAGVWVPEFYRSLGTPDYADAASALRNAQLQLRRNHLFSHPFYWAGLEIIDTVYVQ